MVFLYSFLILVVLVNIGLKKNGWYQTLFGDILKFKNVPKGLKIGNVGSNPGKYAFDYSDIKGEGMNLAVGPQTLEYDCLILKRYVDNISPNGILIIPISPFSSILDYYTNKERYDKYHLILGENIRHYSLLRKIKMRCFIIAPILYALLYPKSFLGAFIRKNNNNMINNPMSDDELKEDALHWMNGWRKDFKIKQLGESLSETHKSAVAINVDRLVEMISICKNKQITPILVLLPMTDFLNRYFTPEIKKLYIYNFLEEVTKRSDVRLLDYMGEKELSQKDLFFNSFFFNQKGAKLFTRKVLKDIALIK